MSHGPAGRRLAIRCDGDATVGAGHVGRCVPLAAAFADRGWAPVFVGSYAGLAAWLLDRAGMPTAAPQDGPCGLGDGWDAAVVDSYAIGEDELCAAAGARPVATLGEARRCPAAGVVLDYHVDTPLPELGGLPPSRLLAGPRYAPLDPALTAARRERTRVERVLVTVGGSDAAQRVVGDIVGLVAATFPGASVLAATERPTALVDVLGDVDVAVSVAGVTAYELACAGVPALVIALVDNQRRIARACNAAGIAVGVDGLASDAAPRCGRVSRGWRIRASARRCRAPDHGCSTAGGRRARRGRSSGAGPPPPRRHRVRAKPPASIGRSLRNFVPTPTFALTWI